MRHQLLTDAVHQHGGKIALQILHAGRYGYHPFQAAPSAVQAPINPFKPRAMSDREVSKTCIYISASVSPLLPFKVRWTIDDYAKCASIARGAGYDGVEIMGSEGYLINEFLVERTNKRTDDWGGTYAKR
jgi:2,4-dienoyl-CoA reductase (NADPH2)